MHGSGRSDRSNPWTSAWAGGLVERGIAVLYPDKRGSGNSGGDWRTSSFEQIADDGIAALELLRQQPGVDSSKVGVIGFSQGGQIVPLMASRSASVGFVIDVSGAVLPLVEQVGDEVRLMAQRQGLDQSGQALAQHLHELAARYALGGTGWEEYASLLEQARAGPWGHTDCILGFPSDQDSEAWTFLRSVGDFDPLPWWCQLQLPAAFIFGGKDENVDVYKNVARIQSKLMDCGLDFELLLFGDNGHTLYREDALAFLARWIHDLPPRNP
ncbi:MAG: alpha/beta fold hydrolase [Candidatus Cloacimonetes bacterium]|nr:alpha/beta fold hydrolase [Candidatus Cloacimonadota bacterium]